MRYVVRTGATYRSQIGYTTCTASFSEPPRLSCLSVAFQEYPLLINRKIVANARRSPWQYCGRSSRRAVQHTIEGDVDIHDVIHGDLGVPTVVFLPASDSEEVRG